MLLFSKKITLLNEIVLEFGFDFPASPHTTVDEASWGFKAFSEK